MKMPRIVPLLLVFWALTAGCSERLEEREELAGYPWSELNFFDRQLTILTLVNESDDTLRYYHRELQDEFYRGGLEGVLPPGDSVAFSSKLWRAERTNIYLKGLADLDAHFFPGLDRTLVWNNGFSDRGPNAATIYSPMLNLHRELKQQGPTTPVTAQVNEILQYYQKKTDYFDRLSDSLSNTGHHPVWLPDMLRRQAHLVAAGEVETIRGYRRMAYLDTFELPPTVDQRIDSMLTDISNISAPNYRSLLNRRMFFERTPADTLPSPRGAGLNITRQYLTKHFLPQKPEMLASFLERMIYNKQQFGGKDDLIESGINSLPAEYRQFLHDLQQILADKNSNNAAIVSLLQTDVQNTNGSLTKLPVARAGNLVLYKFWFPGCAPCVRQYPHEKRLLENYPQLRLTYIGYLTFTDTWTNYVRNHQMPTDQQYFLPKQHEQLAKDALGLLGAPRYVLTGPEGKVVCRACPKPEDPSLRELIEKTLD